MLEQWRQQLAPYFVEGSELRRKTLERLSTAYWTGLFQQRLDEYERHEREAAKPKPKDP